MRLNSLNQIPKIAKAGEQGQRVVVVGSSGTGKSYLGRQLLMFGTNLHCLLIDLKDDTDIEKHLIQLCRKNERIYITSDYNQAIKNLPYFRVVIYRPVIDYDDTNFYRNLDRDIYHFFLTVRNCAIFFDEAYLLHKGNGINALMTQSRSKNITVFAMTQRPVNCPKTIMTESNICFAFRLNIYDDLQTVSKNFGIQPNDVQQLGQYEFLCTGITLNER